MRSTFSYRDLPVYTAGFSPDGSLVALVHGLVVTLWDTERNVFLRALESVIDARKLGFAGPEGRYIVVAGPRKGIAVWDLLSCELVQTLPQQPADLLVALPTGILAAHSSGPKAKGDAGRTDIAFLSPAGAPGRTVNLKVQLSVLAPLPSPTAAHLVGIAPTGEIYRFGELQKAAAPTARGIVSATAPVRQATSIWQEMFGKDAFLDELSAPEEPADAPAAISALQRHAAGRPEAVFDGPSHTLPPLGLLFDAFMDELLAPLAPAEDGDVVMAEVEEEGDAPAPALALAADAVRAVTEKEMGELTGFFRDLRAGSAPAQSAPRPSKPKQRPNGLPNGNGHARDRAVSTPTKGSKKHLTADASPAAPATDDEPEVVDGKRKSKKRKAPRHSGV